MGIGIGNRMMLRRPAWARDSAIELISNLYLEQYRTRYHTYDDTAVGGVCCKSRFHIHTVDPEACLRYVSRT